MAVPPTANALEEVRLQRGAYVTRKLVPPSSGDVSYLRLHGLYTFNSSVRLERLS